MYTVIYITVWLVSHFFENILLSGLTFFSSNGIIAIKINIKKCKKKAQENKRKILEKQENWLSNEKKGELTQIILCKKDNL